MPDEARLERIENNLNAEVKESATFRGELRQFMSALPISTDAAVQRLIVVHNADKDAHGAGVARELDKKIVGWATVGATVLAGFAGVIGAAAHKFWSHTP